MLSDEDARYGVAYNVLYARLAPAYCANQNNLKHLREELAKIMLWASSQPADIAAAYHRAGPEIETNAIAMVENNERAAKMLDLKKTFPMPPL